MGSPWLTNTSTVVTFSVILRMNGVAVARHGLILWENEATGFRKLSRCLRGPKNLINRLANEKM